ncbi:MAG: MerR family transcriptional regulator [Desulfobacteraceae bacterium]|nr:MAG: MerR family transcriptional regulator [Desulfobacteraceae bacterium]
MELAYKTDLVMRLTGATSNQLKYWGRIGLVSPRINGRRAQYSFKDIVKLRVLVSLRHNGISLQKVRLGISRLSEILPDDAPVTRLLIYTDGMDMIVVEKGKYFSAITKQQYFRFDTEQIGAEITELEQNRLNPPQERAVSLKRD